MVLQKVRLVIGVCITPVTNFRARIHSGISNRVHIATDTDRGSWILFGILFAVLVVVVWLLPSVTPLTKTLQVARIVTLVGIFGLACFSLNLHTGITGLTNFGVIFLLVLEP